MSAIHISLPAKASLVTFLLCASAAAFADPPDTGEPVEESPVEKKTGLSLPCDPDGECSDPCKYFNKHTVFAWGSAGPVLEYKGKIHTLKEVRRVAVRSIQSLTDVPGGSERVDFVSGKLKVSLTTSTTATSCYEKDRRGRWRSLDTCCWSTQQLTLVIHDGKQTTRLKTTADYGC